VKDDGLTTTSTLAEELVVETTPHPEELIVEASIATPVEELVQEASPPAPAEELVQEATTPAPAKELVQEAATPAPAKELVQEAATPAAVEEPVGEAKAPTTDKPKRRKRQHTNPLDWEKNMNKIKREAGQSYFGKKKIEESWCYDIPKNERELKSRCKCKSQQNKYCAELSDAERNSIFQKFWKMDWNAKKVFVSMLTVTKDVARRRPTDSVKKKPRENTVFYYLPTSSNEKKKVCKVMFLNTLSVGEMQIRSWIREKPETAEREIAIAPPRSQKIYLSMVDFLKRLPQMESHYCRARTKKTYLEPIWGSKAEIFRLWQDETPAIKGNLATFHHAFADLNMGLFKPRKDLCEVCETYDKKNITEEEYNLHITKKKEAKSEMLRDMEDPNCCVFTMDLQAVMMAPYSNVSTMYYKTKLIVHNFVIYNNKTNKAHCFLWNESDGGLNANELATIITKFLASEIEDDSSKKIILYSDGCTYQNRNATLANAIINLVKVKRITLIQKFLEKGHTQMEVDSVHAAIERKKKKRRLISVPFDYVEVIASANFKNPYEVTYLHYDFF